MIILRRLNFYREKKSVVQGETSEGQIYFLGDFAGTPHYGQSKSNCTRIKFVQKISHRSFANVAIHK
jgi:hypothetical protein